MAVMQVKKNEITKDGRSWIFYCYVSDVYGNKTRYKSKKYKTKEEAKEEEIRFLAKVDRKEINLTDMTFQDLYEEFYTYKQDKVKNTTLRSYVVNVRSLEDIMKLKIRDFNVTHYQKWRASVASQPLAIKTKNGYFKFFKNLLNYGTKCHDFNFAPIYNKMEKFTDPNALPREMQFYTFEEFKQFISVIDDIKWKCCFEVLYYCGLRRSELRGLTWDNIDLFNKELSVNKNVTNLKGDSGYWTLTTPKTRTSVRTIPMPDILVNDLKELKAFNKQHQHGFNEKYFVFGDTTPLHPFKLLKTKNNFAEEAGVKQIRTHDFRHSCASLLINNGASIMILAKYLGHAKIDETLNTYSHLFKTKMDEVVNLMNKMNENYDNQNK